MDEETIERIIAAEAQRRHEALQHVRSLAARQADGLAVRCTHYRTRRAILRGAATLCLLAGTTLASDAAFASPGYGARTTYGDATHAVIQLDNIINTL